MKPAFLIVDMQKAYFEGDSRKSMEGATEYINETAKMFRERSLPVVWIQDIDESDGVIISGYCAEHCVLSTYRGALNHDLEPVLLKNGVASGDGENLACVEKISNAISFTMVSKMLENVGESPV